MRRLGPQRGPKQWRNKPLSSPLDTSTAAFPSFASILIVPFLQGGEITPSWIESSPPPIAVAGTKSFSDARHRETLGTPAWLRAGPSSPTVLTIGGASIIDARHREIIEGQSWLRGGIQTPPAQAPVGRVIVGPQNPDQPAAWLGEGVQDSRLPIIAKAITEPQSGTTSSWTRSPIQPTVIQNPVGGRAVSETLAASTTPSWLQFSAATPAVDVQGEGGTTIVNARHSDFYSTPSWTWGKPVPSAPTAGQFFGKAISEIQRNDSTPLWLRPSVTATPIVSAQGNGGTQFVNARHSDFYATPAWLRGSLINQLVPSNVTVGAFDAIPTPSWTSGIPLQQPAPTPGLVSGQAVSDPWPNFSTPSWTRGSLIDQLAPINITLGAAWGDEVTPAWLKSTQNATPIEPLTVPLAGTIVVGPAPYETPPTWLNPAPIPAFVPPARVVTVGPLQSQETQSWLRPPLLAEEKEEEEERDRGAKWPVRVTEYLTKIKNRFYWFRDESELPKEEVVKEVAPVLVAKAEVVPQITEEVKAEVALQSEAEAKRKRIERNNEAIMKLFL